MATVLIKTAADLVTSHEATRAGFAAQALAKTEKAAPYVAQAKRLLTHLQAAKDPHEAAAIPEIRADLSAAAGISDKAQSHLSDADLTTIIDAMVATLAAMTQDWREELLYRYLLTRGDSLGGRMRNWVHPTKAYLDSWIA